MCDAIGIDLGTSNSCVGIWKNRKVEIVANEDGKRESPSIIWLNEENQWLAGRAVCRQMLNTFPKSTIYDAKRMLGKPFGDEDIQQLRRIWPFTLVNHKGLPVIQVEPFENSNNNDDGNNRNENTATTSKDVKPFLLKPWEVSAMVLKELKATAERGLENRYVRMAVIGVPANFGEPQKRETMLAAKEAGFEEIKLITEPSAAAIAYGFDLNEHDGYRLLVFDFGGGTFDVTIIQATKGEFTQLETLGANIGGRDVDKLLFDWCLGEIKREHGFDLRAQVNNKKLCQKLMGQCIKAKEDLSNLDLYQYNLRGKTLQITRDQFNKLCTALLRRTIDLTEKALKGAGLTPEQIDRVLLVGGSTRIPAVRSLLAQLFPGNLFDERVNPDHAVATGATILAAQHGGIATKDDVKIQLREILPLSIGVDSSKGAFLRIVPRGIVIPTQIFTDQFWTSKNDQKGMLFEFYQGEHTESDKNIYIGSLELLDKLPGPAEGTAAQLSVHVDGNGLLEASASYKGEPVRCRFEHNVAKLDRDKVEKELKKAAMSKATGAGTKRAATADAKAELESLLERAKYMAKEEKKDKTRKGSIEDLCRDQTTWLGQHPNAEAQKYRKQLKSFRDELKAIDEDN